MTTANLGFAIDSSQAVGAAADLDKLTASAARTQQAADKLEAEASSLGAALGKAGEGASKAKPAVDNLGKTLEAQDEHVRAFRMEVERLTMKYQPLAAATSKYAATVSEVERAHRLGIISADQMTKRLDEERLAFERLKTTATAAGAAVKAANTNVGASRAAGINAGYQAQDVVVSAFGGMNAGLIGLQQGTQLAASISTMERPVAGLAAAFASLISPVSLVTIGLTAGVAALIQYFTTADEGTGKTSKLFEEQNDLIRRAADLWGDAAPALKAYVDELDRAEKITQGREAGEILAGRSLEGLSENLDSIKREGMEAFRALRGDGNNANIVRDLRDAWGDLRERLDNGTASMADLNRVQRELSNAVSQYGVPEVLAFSEAFDKVTAAIYRGVEAAQKARTEWIAALAGGANVQDILSGATFTENGRTLRSADFVPTNIPTPGRRPSDLDRDPEAANILNSDGRLVGVPVPGRKPNKFELEQEADKVDDVTKAYRRAQEAKADFWLDLSFQERQAGRSAMDQQVATTLGRYGFDENLNSPEANAIRQRLQFTENKEAANDFMQDFKSALIANGGDIGDAFAESLKNALINQMSKAWEKIFDQLSTAFANWMTGGNKTAGAGAVSNLLGGANDNKAFAAPVGAVTRGALPAVGNMGAYAKAIQSIESGGRYDIMGPVTKSGDRAYGAYQVMGNNVGPWSEAALGRRLTPEQFLGDRSAQDAVFNHRFGGYVDKYGASGAAQAWFGGPGSVGKGGGASDILGTTGTAYVNKFNASLEKASGGLGQFGNGLSAIGQNFGGAGGIGKLAGGFDWSSLFSSAWKPNTTLGAFLGANANGTDYWRGGPSLVGERGPELLNLPQGSQVMSNHKLMAALANDNGGSRSVSDVRVSVDNNGNLQAYVARTSRESASAVTNQKFADFGNDQRRGGINEMNRKFASQKG